MKEEAIYLRERAIGLRRSAYLCSKILTFGTITAVQCALLVMVATMNAGAQGSGNLLPARLELFVVIAACGVATLVLGLLISALVSTSEKAMALIPVVFVASWLFSGAAVDLQTKPIMRDIAYLTTANWGMSAAASTADLRTLEGNPCIGGGGASGSGLTVRNAGTPRSIAPTHCDAGWSRGLGTWAWDMFMLVALGVLLALGADWALARKEPLESERRRYALAVAFERARQRIGRANRA